MTSGAVYVNLANAVRSVTIRGCTFAYNLDSVPAGAAGIYVDNATVNLVNSIVYGNRPRTGTTGASDLLTSPTGQIRSSYSMITADTLAVHRGNFTDVIGTFFGDPLFVTTSDEFSACVLEENGNLRFKTATAEDIAALCGFDVHLRSKLGYWLNDGTYVASGDENSLALDKGDPTADYSREVEPNGGRVNAGCYGNTPEASHSRVDKPDGTCWLYDPANGTVTDSFWTFLASDDGAGNVVFNSHTGAYPDLAGDLDFSKPVKDAANNSYTIVRLNPGFNNDPAGKRIARLVFPAEGVAEIGDNAFNQCTAITNIVNFLPDSVTKVGKYAFYKCPVKQTLYVKGVPRFGTGVGGNNNFSQCAFNSSSITRIVFGPDLKEIFDWDSGPFTSCTSLTNITFDAAMTGAKFAGARNGGFYNCTALTGTIDLSGFSDLSYVSDYGGDNNIFSGTKVEHFIVGERCTKLGAGFFAGVSTLKDVTFTGPPPTIETGVNTSGGWSARRASRFFDSNNQSEIKITTRIYKQYREAWLPYTTATSVDQLKRKCNITWKPEYVAEGVDLSLRPFSVVDDCSGMIIIWK